MKNEIPLLSKHLLGLGHTHGGLIDIHRDAHHLFIERVYGWELIEWY